LFNFLRKAKKNVIKQKCLIFKTGTEDANKNLKKKLTLMKLILLEDRNRR